jgi:hypothetical protein
MRIVLARRQRRQRRQIKVVVQLHGTFSGTFAASSASSRDKFRVYPTSQYCIGMQSGVTFGDLNDWAMTFQMNNDDDRGFWWGDESHGVNQGSMALSTRGWLNVAERIKVGGGQTDTGAPSCCLQVNGEQQWTGTGRAFHANYSTNRDWYIRSGNASGKVILQEFGGNVGVGNASPTEKLHVSGNIKVSGHVEAPVIYTNGLYWGGSNYVTYTYEGFLSSTYKRLAGQRFSGMIVFTPVSNDHSAAVFTVAQNSASGNGSIAGTNRMINYYNGGQYINYRWNGGWLELFGQGMSGYQYYRISIIGSIV